VIPSAWYPLIPSSHLPAGSSAELELAGKPLLLARSESGEVRGGQGTHAIRERNGLVFVWHGDGEPTFDVEELEEVTSPDWTPVRWMKLRTFETTIENVMRDVVDNAHFGPVHKLQDADTRAWQEGLHLITRSQGIVDLRRFGGPPLRGHLRLDGRVHGPGLLTYRSLVTVGIQMRQILLSAAAPLDDNRVQIWIGVTVPTPPVPGLTRLIVSNYLRALQIDYLADAEFWESEEGRMPAKPADEIEAGLYAVFDRWMSGFEGDAVAA